MKSEQRNPIVRKLAISLLAVLFLVPALAQAQAVIKVNDNINIKFGTLIQAWADEQQDAASRGYIGNLFLRRARFIVAGQVAPDVTFFFETDNPNLGKTPKALGSGFITQDAFVEWKPRKEFALDGGLILIPLCRNCLQSAAGLISLDYGAFSFLQSGPTQSSVGRDTGFQAKGYLDKDHFEYRLGVFQGIRGATGRNPFRVAGRVQYNFFDTEVGPFYQGVYFGNKKIVAIGGGLDHQIDYKAYSADIYTSIPLPNKNAFNGQIDLIRYDGGKTFPAGTTTALLRQNTFFAEGGLYLAPAKAMPFLRYEEQKFSDSVNKAKDQQRYQAGLAFYPHGANYNIKGAYTHVKPKTGNTTNEFTIQMQFFYF